MHSRLSNRCKNRRKNTISKTRMRVRLYYQFPFKMNSNTCHQYVGVKKTLKTGFSNLHAMQLARAPQQKLNLVLCMLQDFIGMDYLLFCSPVKFHSRMHFCRWFFFYFDGEKHFLSKKRRGKFFVREDLLFCFPYKTAKIIDYEKKMGSLA
jgi:hypothetical protein